MSTRCLPPTEKVPLFNMFPATQIYLHILMSRYLSVAGQMYHGGIRTLSDFNNATKQGTYHYSGGNTEGIGTSNFGVVIVFTSESYIAQIMVGPLFSWRTSYDNGQNWTSWKDVTV